MAGPIAAEAVERCPVRNYHALPVGWRTLVPASELGAVAEAGSGSQARPGLL
jgi:hypothetical protein